MVIERTEIISRYVVKYKDKRYVRAITTGVYDEDEVFIEWYQFSNEQLYEVVPELVTELEMAFNNSVD